MLNDKVAIDRPAVTVLELYPALLQTWRIDV